MTNWGQATDIDVVAAGAGRVVGVAWARPVQHENIIDVPAAHHEIVIAVHPDYHGEGIGATLMSGVKAWPDACQIDMALTKVRESRYSALLWLGFW